MRLVLRFFGLLFAAGTILFVVAVAGAAGFLWLGLIAVVATPASRVVASLVGYLRGGERPMAVIAGLILAVIALSVGLAIGLDS